MSTGTAEEIGRLQLAALPLLAATVSCAAVGFAPSAGAVVDATSVTHPNAAEAGSASTGCASAGEVEATIRLPLPASPVLKLSDSSSSPDVAQMAAVAVASPATLSRDNASAGCASASERQATRKPPSFASPVLSAGASSALLGVAPQTRQHVGRRGFDRPARGDRQAAFVHLPGIDASCLFGVGRRGADGDGGARRCGRPQTRQLGGRLRVDRRGRGNGLAAV